MVPQDDDLTDLLRRGYKTMQIASLINSLLPENGGGQLPIVKACYDFTTSMTPIICLLVDLAKNPHHEISMTNMKYFYLDYMTLLCSRFKQNMNDPFELIELRQNGAHGAGRYAQIRIVSNPLSRALVSDLGDILHIPHIIKCVEHLIALGANPKHPFLHMTDIPDNVNSTFIDTNQPERYNECNGRSLVYVALIACRSVALAAALMKRGATIDDSTTFFTDVVNALKDTDQIRELIDLFKAHVPNDVMRSISAADSSGRNPLHYLAIMPPKNDDDKLYALQYLHSVLGLPLGPDNSRTTPQQHAQNYRDDRFNPVYPTHLNHHRAASQKMIDELHRLHNIDQTSLVHGALRNSGLSTEIRGNIANQVLGPRGGSMLERYGRNELTALNRLRKSEPDLEKMTLDPH